MVQGPEEVTDGRGGIATRFVIDDGADIRVEMVYGAGGEVVKWLQSDPSMKLPPQCRTKETDRSGRPWLVTSKWAVLDGRMEPTSVTVEATKNSAAPVSAEATKQLSLGTILKEHRHLMVHHSRDAAANRKENAQEEAAFERQAAQFGAHQVLARTPEALDVVADVYRDAYERGEPVQQAVADAFGISRSTAANRIMLARRAGHEMPNPKDTR